MSVKILNHIAKWIFILCIPMMLLSGSIACAANSLWLYKYGFSEYDVSSTTGITEAELERAAEDLISYFRSGEEPLDITVEKDGSPFALFNHEEVVHMKDVKGLFRLDYFLLLGTLICVLGFSAFCLLQRDGRLRQRLAREVMWGSGITLVIMLVLGLGILLDFDWLFLQFHFISFTNEFWSAEGYMRLLFPPGFWYDTARLCAVGTAVAAAVLGGAAGGYMLVTKKALHFRR